MKAVIFAGGVGTRLWPLSRKKSPKQFEKVIGDKSTLQLAVERLIPEFKWQDIIVSTAQQYVPLVAQQLPLIPPENIIGEPETRDVGPAVGLVTALLMKRFAHEPFVILWSDHIVKNVKRFKQILEVSGNTIRKRTEGIIFISQKPRFASQNLGWIQYGKKVFESSGNNFYSFASFHYRPDIEHAQIFFKSGKYAWNLGYFVTTPSFLWKLYEKHQPEMFTTLTKIYEASHTKSYKNILKTVYPTMPKISFDNAILEFIHPQDALVTCEDIGWSDVGAWEALKEALQQSPRENVIQGKVLLTDCTDSLVYNYTDQLVVTIDLDGLLVINTHDVVLVCHKNSVPKIKQLVERLSKSENDHLI